MESRPPVSVVVPFAGSDGALAALTARLESLERRPGDELIVADNRGTGGTPSRAGDVVIHPAGGVRSPGFARNRGASLATGEWLLFIDADTEPQPGLIDTYFATAPQASTAILAGGIVDTLPEAGTGLAARHVVARAQMSQAVTVARPTFAYAQTANCAIRRRAFAEVGGFEEGVRAGEDADLCFRLLERGWQLEERPAAVVEHRARATLGALLRQLARHGSGAAWCERRHPGSFPPPTAWALARRVAAGAARAAAATAAGEREQAAFAGIEIAEAAAFTLGRLLPNRAHR
jgi:GT2 family glycosyltransferase